MKRIGEDVCYTVHDYVKLAIMFAITCAIIMSGVQVGIVVGSSMQSTLAEYSIHILVPVQEPEIGDIVAFCHERYDATLVKHIDAGPGDTVDFWGNPLTLGPREYFVVGDNPTNSTDSRSFGPISGLDIMAFPASRWTAPVSTT